MANSIQFVQPDKALQNYVQYYYMADLSGSPEKEGFEQKTLSTGCVEMFIGYQNTRDTSFTGLENTVQTKSAIVGVHNLKNNIQVMMGSENETLKFISITFRPKGFYEIFKIPSSEIFSGVFVSNEVLGNEFKHLHEQLDNTQNNNDRRICLDNFLIKQLNKNKYKRYTISAGFKIADFIDTYKGNVRIKQLTAGFNISERSLQRNFKSALGLSLKEYCKITRFQNLLDFTNSNTNINWADMVSQFGYYDQSHLINEFKDAIDITPTLFMKHNHRDIFKIGNHLAILKKNIDYSLIQDVIAKGKESHIQSMSGEF